MNPKLGTALVLALAWTNAQGATADAVASYPNRPIRIIVAYTPAGTTDILARLVAQKMNESWSQPVIVENRPGANGNIGTEIAARATPDGYTLLMATSATHGINITLYPKLAWHPQRDFEPISLVATVPNLLVVNNALPVKSVKELIAYAKANPGKLSFGSPGIGSTGHLSMELFKTLTGTSMVHVPYKGSAGVLADVTGGQIQLTMDNIPVYLPHAKAGKIRAVALSSSQRTPAAPEIPTVAEAGVPGFEASAWFALFAPAKTSKAIVQKLAAETQRILKLPDVSERLAGLGAQAVGSTPEDLATFNASEITKWRKVIQQADVKLEAVIREPESFAILIDTIERFVRDRLIPREEEVVDTDAIPDDILSDMRRMGLFGLTIPEEYGGLGLTMEEEVLAAMSLCRAAPAFRSIMGTNNGIGSLGLVFDGTDAQKKKYLPKLATGELIGSFALTEPGSGSDAGSLTTSARREGDHYVLNGTKRFITNAPQAGIFTVMARTNPESKDASGVSAFIVERATPGLSVGPPDRKMGQRGAQTADVIFENAKVPAANVIGGIEGQGFKTAMKVLDKARLLIAAVCVGAAGRILEESLNYAIERKQFGQPIGEFQLVQAMLADCQAELYAARSMTLDAARKRDNGENVTLEAACCKFYASEMVGRVADRGVQIHGGAGYMQESVVERFYRDVRLFRLYEGTSQIQQLIIARNMLKRARG